MGFIDSAIVADCQAGAKSRHTLQGVKSKCESLLLRGEPPRRARQRRALAGRRSDTPGVGSKKTRHPGGERNSHRYVLGR